MNYKHLLGRKFIWQQQDCYALLRDFYRDVFQIELPNYARPDDFWQTGLNLFFDSSRDAGFYELNVHPSQYKFGDVVVSAIDSGFGNHCAIFVENGRIIHHLYNRLSEGPVPFKGLVRNTCVGVYRHKDVPDLAVLETEVADIRSFLSPKKQKLLDELRATHSGPQSETN
ncbi:NlpC/P60 family protein [Mesorhizobium sp. WSM2239]|uniref:NlpC/P60 family protein n=2 Tax=unclassified Mesorhizobium TaxID=325217 RepID=A0AAU8DFK4_9HYPH